MADEADLLIQAGYSDAKLARDAQKLLAHADKTGKEIGKAMQGSMDKVADGEAFKATARQIDSLKRKYDPLYAASKKYEKALDDLNKAQKAGAINARQYDAALARLNDDLSGGAAKAEATSRRFGGSLQQVGYQVGDFAVQVGAGTSATQALGQQLPQLLGAFGTFGALAGAAAAIMIPLGSAILKTAFDSETLEDRMKALEKTTDAMTTAAQIAATPLNELRAKYGDLADEILRANQASASFTAALAQVDLVSASKKAAGEMFGGAFEVDAGSQLSSIDQGGLYIIKLADTLKMSRDEARRFAAAMKDLQGAKDAKEVAAATSDLLAILQASPEAAKRFGAELRTLGEINATAAKQIEAVTTESRRLQETYNATTQKLAGLADDLKKAEAERAKAVAAGLVEEEAKWAKIAQAIRWSIEETRQLANETDTAFERMSKAAEGYLAKAGKFVAGYMAPEGFESRYIEERARGAGSKNEEAVRAATAAAEQLGVAAKDLLAVMSFESGIDPSRKGGAGGKYLGLIQFSPENQRRYGVNAGQTTAQQMGAVVKYLKDTGVKPGMGIEHIYAAILAGDARKINASDRKNGGIVDNVYADTRGTKFAPHINKAAGLLAAYPDVVQETNEGIRETKRLEDESAAAVKREVAERKRKAEALEKAKEAMSQNLISQQKAADLEAQRAQQIAAINASGGTDAEKAAAIAKVNAEMERQITVMALMEEAKRRQVDLDALMVGSTMTYRQAIEALGDAKAQSILIDQQRAASEKDAAEQLAFATEQQRTFEEGVVDAIMSVDDFGDALEQLALRLLQARIQADLMAGLFGKGPTAGSWGVSEGGGLLSGISKWLGFRAAGGPVDSGRPYVVGERGPEIIVPRAPGHVIPNHGLRQAGTINVSPSTTLIINGGADEQARMSLMRELDRRDAALKRALPGVIADARARGRM